MLIQARNITLNAKMIWKERANNSSIFDHFNKPYNKISRFSYANKRQVAQTLQQPSTRQDIVKSNRALGRLVEMNKLSNLYVKLIEGK